MAACFPFNDFADWQNWPRGWMNAFIDRDGGGAHERLDASRCSLNMDKRLVTQCRQVIVYALASDGGRDATYLEAAAYVYDFIRAHYCGDMDGSYHFSVKPDGVLVDSRLDLYGTAFFILASAMLYRAGGNKNAADYAAQTLDFIDTHFRHESGFGFHEALDGGGKPVRELRRQNPHMHLFEACLYAHDAFGDARYRRMADELLGLFVNHFYAHDKGVVIEFFDEALHPHPDKGKHVEVGHIAEWIWLLERYKESFGVTDPALDAMQDGLFGWLDRHALDPVEGGILNAQTPDGVPLDMDKRIWPLFETLRAAAIMRRRAGKAERAAILADAVCAIITSRYIRFDGWWTEIRHRDFGVASDFYPGTTPYHIYGTLFETNIYEVVYKTS